MTRKELEDMKGFASILKSRLEDALDTREYIYDRLKDLMYTPIKDLFHEIDRLQDLDTILDENLTDLDEAIEELEKALNRIDIVE
jgi:hypothetical protein|nr:MAG TPA: hypothetical protein [Caudoviricetes sp.]